MQNSILKKMSMAERQRDANWAMNEFADAEYAFLAVNGEDGYPYNVPLCVFRVDDSLYFHTALNWHLNDLLKQNVRVCVTCVNYAERDPENTTMRYRSAMAFGEVELIEDKQEKMRIFKAFFSKFLPENPKEDYYLDRISTIALLYRIRIEAAIGKESLPEKQM